LPEPGGTASAGRLMSSLPRDFAHRMPDKVGVTRNNVGHQEDLHFRFII
jgi:hypothetical protein